MPKGKKTKKRCQRHQFILKPLNDRCHFNQIITNSFCDAQLDKYNKQKHQKHPSLCLNCPQYNKDKNFSTPTFILPTQKSYFFSNYSKIKQEHQIKVVDYADQKSDLLIPKPRSKNNYCSVCKQNYDDYLNHINNERHKRKINASTYNKHILNLIDKFQDQNNIQKITFSDRHTTNLFQQDLSVQQIDDKQFLEMGRPRKKLKCHQPLNRFYLNQNENIINLPINSKYSQGYLNYMNQQVYGNHPQPLKNLQNINNLNCLNNLKNLNNLNNFSQKMFINTPVANINQNFYLKYQGYENISNPNNFNNISNIIHLNNINNLSSYYSHQFQNLQLNNNNNKRYNSSQNQNNLNVCTNIDFQNYQVNQFRQMINIGDQNLINIHPTMSNRSKINSSQSQATAPYHSVLFNQFYNTNEYYPIPIVQQNNFHNNFEGNQKSQLIVLDDDSQ